MAATLTQSKANVTAGSNITVTYAGTPAQGALLLASITNNTGTAQPTVSDSNGNWTMINSITRTGNAQWLFGIKAVTSQPTAINAVRSTDVLNMNLYEFAGTTNTVDQSSSATGASAATTSPTQPTITTTIATDLIFAQLGVSNTITSPTYSDGTFTLGLASPVGGILTVDYWKSVTATGTFNASYSWTTSRSWMQLITSFKLNSSGLWLGF